MARPKKSKAVSKAETKEGEAVLQSARELIGNYETWRDTVKESGSVRSIGQVQGLSLDTLEGISHLLQRVYQTEFVEKS